MKIRLLYFAVIREITDKNHEDMDLDASATVRQLLVRFVEQYPKTEGVIAACRIAVNQDFVPLDHILRPNDEVAFIPPVAGGEKANQLAAAISLQKEPLSVTPIFEALSQPQIGALVIMVGTVRNRNEGASVSGLRYEAYFPMVEKVLKQIIQEAKIRFPDAELAVSHRVDELEIGERAVVVGAGAPHREEAFGACRYVIEALKKDAPIWKYETREDGQTWIGLGP